MEWTPKDPDDTRIYSYDWSEIYPDTILSATFSKTSGTVVLSEVIPDPRMAFVKVAGGADGETATITHTLVTNAGQTFVRTITLDIVSDADAISPISGYTKGDIVLLALKDLGITHYVFDIEAEESIDALRELDMMMAEWGAQLEPMGYLFPGSSGSSLPSDAAGIDESIISAVAANLATRIAPTYGKTPGGPLVRKAATGRGFVSVLYRKRIEIAMPHRMPVGAGNKFFGRFFPRTVV